MFLTPFFSLLQLSHTQILSLAVGNANFIFENKFISLKNAGINFHHKGNLKYIFSTKNVSTTFYTKINTGAFDMDALKCLEAEVPVNACVAWLICLWKIFFYIFFSIIFQQECGCKCMYTAIVNPIVCINKVDLLY